nr:hypothetical protein BgiMline_008023 [Biomphalaria glabrata]
MVFYRNQNGVWTLEETKTVFGLWKEHKWCLVGTKIVFGLWKEQKMFLDFGRNKNGVWTLEGTKMVFGRKEENQNKMLEKKKKTHANEK